MSSVSAETRPGCTHCHTVSPSICLLSLAHHTLFLYTHKYTNTGLWMNPVTLWWCICHISTSIQSHAFKGLSLFMAPRVHILSLDICGETHDSPEHWCLTAADTESRLSGHRHRQHWRAWNGATSGLCFQVQMSSPVVKKKSEIVSERLEFAVNI